MTLAALIRNSRLAVLAILAASAVVPTFAQQVVSCTDPPGGTVTCEKSQVASCTVKNGKVEGRCQNKPPGMGSRDLQAWTLSQFLGKRVLTEDLNTSDYIEILKNGRVVNDGKVTTFSIPSEPSKEKTPDIFKDSSLQEKNNISGDGNIVGNNVFGSNNNAVFGNNSRIVLGAEPRSLTSEQRNDLAKFVSALPTTVRLSVLAVNDGEAQVYAKQFDDILGATNRRAGDMSLGLTWSPSVPIGLQFEIHSLQDTILNTAQQFLDKARNAGIIASPTINKSVPEGTIRILVGYNPKSVKQQ
jgi:hypothetical protein